MQQAQEDLAHFHFVPSPSLGIGYICFNTRLHTYTLMDCILLELSKSLLKQLNLCVT